jgi:hypothetical protein
LLAVKYINLADFNPSKEPYAIVDQDVFKAISQCLEANERGEVPTFSPSESVKRIQLMALEIEKKLLEVL